MSESEEDKYRNLSIAGVIQHAARLYECGDAKTAANYVSSCLEEHPNSAALHGYLAASLSLMGNFKEALVQAERAVSLAPNSEKWSMVLTRTLWKMGRQDEASKEIRRYLDISPSEIYSRMLRRLEDLDPGLNPNE